MSRRNDLSVLIPPVSSPGEPFLQDRVFLIYSHFSACPVLSRGSAAIQLGSWGLQLGKGSSRPSPSSPLSPGHLTALTQAPLSVTGD